MVPVERKNDMEEFIIEWAEKGNKVYPKFVELTADICKKEGYGYKSGQKIKGRGHKIAISRVIEKVFKELLEKQAKEISTPENLSVREVLDFQEKKYSEILQKVKKNMK